MSNEADWKGDVKACLDQPVFQNKFVWRLTQGIVGGGLAFSLLLGLRYGRKGLLYGTGFGLGYAVDESFDLNWIQ